MKSFQFIKTFLLLTTLLFIYSSAVVAAPGDFDPTFGQGGRTFSGVSGKGNDKPYATAIQTDGKIVVAGTVDLGFEKGCGFARYNPDGSLDATFDGDGKTVVRLSPWFECYAMAIGRDGKIVAAGFSRNGLGNALDQDFAVTRLNPDGSLDASFDGDGLLTTNIPDSNNVALSVAIQNNDKILVMGQGQPSFSNYGDSSVVRYNPDGSIDSTFGNGGRVHLNDNPLCMTLQSDGKIIIAGYKINNPNGTDFMLVRLIADGTPDPDFGVGGTVVTDLSNDGERVHAVAVQPDGRIVAAGSSANHLAMARYNDDGALDPSFGQKGKVLLTNTGLAYDVEIQADAKIVAAGNSGQQNGSEGAVARFDADGELDTTFNGGGLVVFTGFNPIQNAAIQTDGKIVAVRFVGVGDNFDFGVARLNTDGSLDNSFDNDGVALTDLGSRPSAAWAVAVQKDNKIVTAGLAVEGQLMHVCVARYKTDGTLDSTFGGDGIVVTPYSQYYHSSAQAIAIQPDGKIVVAAVTSGYYILAYRYNTDGTLDPTFDGDGKVFLPGGILTSLAIQTDGKIVFGGYLNSAATGDDFFLARINADGSLDTSFEGDGLVTTPVSPNYDRIQALGIQPDGKIVAAGAAGLQNRMNFTVVRYNSDGSLDTTFDGDGIAATPILDMNMATALAIQPDGRIIVGGYAQNNYVSDFALVRYNANGSLDQTFDGDGILTTDFDGNSHERLNSISLQPDGKIIAAGNYYFTEDSDFALVRYNPDGTLDDSFASKNDSVFGSGGKVRFTFVPGSRDQLYGTALDSMGRIVVAGESDGLFVAARLLGDDAPVLDFAVSGTVRNGKSGVANVIVRMTDAGGTTLTTRTNSFGNYRFENVSSGNAVITVSSRRYAFENSTRSINVSGNIRDLDFAAVD